MMTGSQLREARRSLGWSTDTLAGMCNLSSNCIYVFERTSPLPRPQRGEQAVDRLAMLTAALETAGVVFTHGGDPEVHLRSAAA